MAISCKGAYFPKEAILMGVRWYLAYPLSTRHVEELMEERGVKVAQSTLTGIELMHMLRKQQLAGGVRQASVRPNSSTPWPPNHLTNRG
jgi:transposase-like protein